MALKRLIVFFMVETLVCLFIYIFLYKLFLWYSSECLKKLGDVLGLKVWNAVNDVFDCMPIAAIVDKTVSSCLLYPENYGIWVNVY